MPLLVGITTAPRSTRYLLTTLRNLVNASMHQDDVHVVIAPNSVDKGEDWDVIKRTVKHCTILEPLCDENGVEYTPSTTLVAEEYTKHMIIKNTDRLIKYLINTGAEYFVTAQDDITFSPNTLARVNAVVRHMHNHDRAVGAVSFYSPYKEFKAHTTALIDYPPLKFYGELFLLWRATTAAEFLQSSITGPHDLVVGQWFNTHPQYKLMAHSPCLVQHIGTDSTWGAASNRTSMSFILEHDAIRDAKRFT